MKRLLILFAKGFPYNTSEPFLENEYPLYREYFDKVLIVTACKRGEQPTRQVNDPSIEIVPDYTLSKDIRSILGALPWILTDRMFYAELKNLFRSGFTWKHLYNMTVFSLCGNHRAMLAYRWLKTHPEYKANVLYSYWMHIPAYAAVRLNQKYNKTLHTISRAHGFELYLERNKTGYCPFHKQLCIHLDEIATISQNGKNYLQKHYGKMQKISVHRLGAVDMGLHNQYAERKPFRIVSCARVIPLKRLNRIIDTLSQMKDYPIHWTHIGGGDALGALKQYAANKLPANVTADFLGAVPNTEVYSIYRERPFHVYINVSEAEGVPVSIMEAMSFDIPVIATAVGGTPELVDAGKNGFLLPADFTDGELAGLLQRMMDMPEPEYQLFRQKARNKFERDYNAIPNYRKFIEHLADMSKE